jgi:hypothetical protein
MFEKNLTEIFDEIWVSFIDPEIAVNRIISRDNFN